ncbi:HPP family protein [Fluviicola sp.]|uniref:HPP family protein n=1 Tax=Fluviicola sp. TaxID=1917219 RepID=UPI0031DFD0BF
MSKKKGNKSLRKAKYVLYKETLVDFREHFWTFVGSFFGIGIIAWIQSFSLDKLDNIFLIGSFGASSVLIYGAIQSPLAQPRNLVFGHVISAFIGVCIFKLFPEQLWISAPLAVSLSIVVMQITKTLHPPGGATALIAVTATPKIKALGFFYVLSPVLTGVLILLIVALIVNNLTKNRKYPTNSRLTKYIRKKK